MKQRYDSYKPSGIDWIGDIPEHWQICRIKHLVSFNSGDTITSEQFIDTGEYPVYGANGHRGQYDKFNFEGKRLLIGRVGALCGNIHLTQGKIWCSEHALISNERFGGLRFDYSWFEFVLKSMNLNQYGGGSAQPVIASSTIENLQILFPPLHEQEAIVGWLDEKCGEIDAAIAKVDREIELIDELKQNEISRVVTHGLNPDATLRPSGIDWIGDVPEHWKITPLKRNLTEPLMYGANEPAESDDTSYPRYIRITDIDPNGNLRSETFKSLEPSKAAPYLLEKGDVLFARSGATVGKTYIFNEKYDACFAGYLIKAKCSKDLNSKFLFYYTLSGVYENWKNSIFIQATIQNIGADKYSLLPLPVPPLPEQQAIADYLDKKCAEIEGLKEKLDKKRETLKELRQAIISEVVTGKRKVI